MQFTFKNLTQTALAAASFLTGTGPSEAADARAADLNGKLATNSQPALTAASSSNKVVVTAAGVTLLNNNLPVTIVPSLNDAAKLGNKFFGLVKLDNNEIVYALRTRDALSGPERQQLSTAERTLYQAENQELRAARAQAKTSGKVTGSVLKVPIDIASGKQPNTRGLANDVARNKTATYIHQLDDSLLARRTVELAQLEVRLGLTAPAGAPRQVFLSFVK